jgi:hypothetical protein
MQRRAGLSLQERGALQLGIASRRPGVRLQQQPPLFMCNAELGVGVGAVETGGLGEESHSGGGEAAQQENWGRDELEDCCFFGFGFVFVFWLCLWLRAQVKSTWGSGLLSISPFRSLHWTLRSTDHQPWLEREKETSTSAPHLNSQSLSFSSPSAPHRSPPLHSTPHAHKWPVNSIRESQPLDRAIGQQIIDRLRSQPILCRGVVFRLASASVSED